MLIAAKVKDRRDGTTTTPACSKTTRLPDQRPDARTDRARPPIRADCSLDIAVIEEPKVDAIVLHHGKEEFQPSSTMVKEDGLPFAMPKKVEMTRREEGQRVGHPRPA